MLRVGNFIKQRIGALLDSLSHWLPIFAHDKIQGVDFEQQFEYNQVVQTNLAGIQKGKWLVFYGGNHSRPALVGKLLIEQVMLKQGLISDQNLQQIRDFAFGAQQELFGPFAAKNADFAVAFHSSNGRKKAFFIDREMPNGNALIHKTTQQSEQERMHQGVHVQVVNGFPIVSYCTNPGIRFSGIRLTKHFLCPFLISIFALPFYDNFVQHLRADPFLLVQFSEFLQRQGNLVAKNRSSLLRTFLKFQVLEGVQGIVVNKIFEGCLSREVMLELMNHAVFIKTLVQITLVTHCG